MAGKIKMGLKETGYKVVDWIHLAHDRDQWRVLMQTLMDLIVSYKMGNLFSSWATISFSERALLHVVS
jgi:hypothetical protein